MNLPTEGGSQEYNYRYTLPVIGMSLIIDKCTGIHIINIVDRWIFMYIDKTLSNNNFKKITYEIVEL